MSPHQGFLTRVTTAPLPHPPLDMRFLLGIEEGIRVAWKSIIANATKHAYMISKNCKEIDITVDLEFELDKTLAAKTCRVFTDEHFIAPKRGTESVSYDGQKLEKRPDLVFSLKARRPGLDFGHYDAVFAECKILDNNSSKNLGLYVKDGLSRFVIGDYAWTMPQSMMIGYLRTSQELPEGLSRYFLKQKTGGEFNSKVYNLLGEPVMCPRSNARNLYRVCRTVHSRSWGYPPDGKRKPGDITIRHLWLEI